MINSGLFSSNTGVWATPLHVFEKLNDEFHFNTDVCALPENAKCSHFYTPEVDGLLQDWSGICFMNPPYGNEIGKWIEKAKIESDKGATIVCLLPARTDTKWFHEHILGHAEIRFIKGRIKFIGAKSPAPFPSMIVVFGKKN